jgi:hypothetical protein
MWTSVSPWRWVPILDGMLRRGFTTVRDCGGADHGRAVQVDPIKSVLTPPGTKRLKLNYDKPLSKSAFKFKFHHYTTGWRRRWTRERSRGPGSVVQVEPMKAVLKPPGFMLLKLNHG